MLPIRGTKKSVDFNSPTFTSWRKPAIYTVPVTLWSYWLRVKVQLRLNEDEKTGPAHKFIADLDGSERAGIVLLCFELHYVLRQRFGKNIAIDGFGSSLIFVVTILRPEAKIFAIYRLLFQTGIMTRPLALVLYEKLLPGSQLANRLQDLGYRVITVSDPDALVVCAEQEKPLLVCADLTAARAKVVDVIAHLKRNPATNHLPIIAFADEKDVSIQSSARDAGATLVVSDAAILTHLEPFLEQALRLD